MTALELNGLRLVRPRDLCHLPPSTPLKLVGWSSVWAWRHDPAAGALRVRDQTSLGGAGTRDRNVHARIRVFDPTGSTALVHRGRSGGRTRSSDVHHLGWHRVQLRIVGDSDTSGGCPLNSRAGISRPNGRRAQRAGFGRVPLRGSRPCARTARLPEQTHLLLPCPDRPPRERRRGPRRLRLATLGSRSGP
jgi:hypothetical protein